jgi:hypothetical protein
MGVANIIQEKIGHLGINWLNGLLREFERREQKT